MEKLISGALGGLGDRLFALASGLRLSKLMGRKPVLWWMKTDHCAAEFSDLFQPYDNLEVINTDLIKAPLPDTEIYRVSQKNLQIGRAFLWCNLFRIHFVT